MSWGIGMHKLLNKYFSNIFMVCTAILVASFIFAANASAVPGTTSVRITDVTASSFSVVWMTDVVADPSVEVYSDSNMTSQAAGVTITPMPGGSQSVIQAAKNKGTIKVMVSGLNPSTKYYVRTVTKESANLANLSYSPLYEVSTTSKAMPYYYSDNVPHGFSNDLVSFKVYMRPSETDAVLRIGDLIILEDEKSAYPLSAFVGDGISSPEGILDLNNIFGVDNLTRYISGGEKIILRIYRGGVLSTLIHYRKVPQNGNMVYVVEPLKGFFADINLDGKINDLDFAEFKKQYRTLPDDVSYNPDFNFVDDSEGRVDIREFSKFSREYGRADVK